MLWERDCDVTSVTTDTAFQSNNLFRETPTLAGLMVDRSFDCSEDSFIRASFNRVS